MKTELRVVGRLGLVALLLWALPLAADYRIEATLAVGYNPWLVALNEVTNTVYVSNYGSPEPSTVAVIDGQTQTITKTIAAYLPLGIAVNPTLNQIYVAQKNQNVLVIDGATYGISPVPVARPVGIGANPLTNKYYVGSVYGHQVTVVDGNTNTPLKNIAVGTEPYGVEVNPITNTVYVCNNATISNSVSVIDGASDQVVATIPVGANPWGLGIDTATNTIYVCNSSANTVSVIDGASNQVVAEIPVGEAPVCAAVDSRSHRVYVTNYYGHTVSVIDGVSLEVIGEIAVGSNPRGIAVNPHTSTIYVCNVESNNLSIIVPEVDEMVPFLIADIGNLIDSGMLDPSVADHLMDPLERADNHLANDEIQATGNSLDSFGKRIKRLVRNNSIEPEAAKQLLASSMAIAIDLGLVAYPEAQKMVQLLIIDVESLAGYGPLRPNQAKQLTLSLERVDKRLAHGDLASAGDKLNTFANQVEALVQNGTLPSAEAQPLLDGAEAIAVELGLSPAAKQVPLDIEPSTWGAIKSMHR